MIKIRLDVDYPYPSRITSFLFTGLNIKTSKNYLKNSKIIAKMINESPEPVMAYWFFTPQTIPDRELLELLDPEKHEVALHVATKPYIEWKELEKATGRKVKYYTVHGTARLLARLMWRRKIWEARAPIPRGFPLKSFYDFPTLALDLLCYRNSTASAVKIAQKSIIKGEVLHIHPEWLFNRGTLNHRGPYYQTLKSLLCIDNEFDNLILQKRWFGRIAKYYELNEYIKDIVPTAKFCSKLAEYGADVFTFIERRWIKPIDNPQSDWIKTEDNIALLHITNYSDWLTKVGKKTRNMIRKSEKSGIKTEVVIPSDILIDGIWKIYNETPIRQGRPFPYYGIKLKDVRAEVNQAQNCTFIGAFYERELVGFIELFHGDQITVTAQILSLQKFWDKAVNNALLAKAVEVCELKNVEWLMYGRIGNHPSLDGFKENNGFSKYKLNRCYIPLTKKGRLLIKLNLHRETKDALPEPIKKLLIPAYSWISRVKTRIRTK